MVQFVQNKKLLAELERLRARVAELEQAAQQASPMTTAYRIASGQAYMLPVSQNISTRRHEAEDEVASIPVEQHILALDAVFETITDGLVVYDHTGNILRANRAFYDSFSIAQPTVFASQPIEERGTQLRVLDENGNLLSSDGWPVNRILGGEHIGSATPLDYTFLTPDERELQMDISGAPMYGPTGVLLGAVVVYHDITLRKRMEKHTNEVLNTLLEMAEVLAQGTDKSPTNPLDSYSLLDHVLQRLITLGRRILHCPRAGILLLDAATERLKSIVVVGTAPEKMQHWQATLVHRTLDEAFFDPHILATLRAGQVIKIPAAISTEHEAGIYMLVPMLAGEQLIGLLTLDYGLHIRDWSSDELVLITAVSRLVTLFLERERLIQERSDSQANELALLEANRRMDEFLSIASHELRTPLTTINGNIQLAKRRAKSLPLPTDAPTTLIEKVTMIQELLSRAERQVRVQNRLVGDLLDVSRIQANRLTLNMDPCDLAVIVRESVEDQRAATANRIITLEGVDDDLHIPIFADADRIGQVVTNFLTNALKYSAADRLVDVRVEVTSDQARVSVRDQGPGLPPEEQEKLWERFYRVPGIVVQSGSGVGLGLGLHICHTIIERHDGHVGVDSVVGQGSTFWFSLPLSTKYS